MAARMLLFLLVLVAYVVDMALWILQAKAGRF